MLWHIAQMSSMIAAGYWELDVGTGTLSLCPRSREMFGLPLHRAEPLGEKDWVRLVHPDDLPVVRRALHAHVVGEKSTPNGFARSAPTDLFARFSGLEARSMISLSARVLLAGTSMSSPQAGWRERRSGTA